MSIEIGKIVKSESHVLYWTHVTNPKEANPSPSPEDCGIASFVKITPQQDPSRTLVGVVVDTLLMDKDFLRAGPRLAASFEDMKIAFPDFIDERIKLVKLLLIGTIEEKKPNHNFPDITPSLGDAVIKMTEAEIKAFHIVGKKFQIGYYNSAIDTKGDLIKPIVLRILGKLGKYFPDQQPVLRLLRTNLEYSLKLGRELK